MGPRNAATLIVILALNYTPKCEPFSLIATGNTAGSKRFPLEYARTLMKEDEFSPRKLRQRRSCLNMAGGWGKRKKEFIPEEFTRGDGVDGERRGFDAYELQDQGEFMNSVKAEQRKFMKKKDDEFLLIAKMAGVTDQTGEGAEPMGRFDGNNDNDFENDSGDVSLFDDSLEDDDIDVSIRWEEDEEDDEATTRRKRINLPDEVLYDGESSITRLDGDIDVRGRTGDW